MLRGVRKDDYSIQIGLDGRCFVIDITMTTITCYPPKTVPRTNHSDANIVFVVVRFVIILYDNLDIMLEFNSFLIM